MRRENRVVRERQRRDEGLGNVINWKKVLRLVFPSPYS